MAMNHLMAMDQAQTKSLYFAAEADVVLRRFGFVDCRGGRATVSRTSRNTSFDTATRLPLAAKYQPI